MTEHKVTIKELREGVTKILNNWYEEPNWVIEDIPALANLINTFYASKGACFPAPKEDIFKMSDPLANYEIVVTLKEMMEDGS